MKSAPTHHPSSTLHTLFQKFDQLVDAPNAVAKIRELVLELALQGKLVNQNPKDGTGHELLKKIYLKRPPPDMGTDVLPVDSESRNLPSTWACSKLGEVTEIIRGVTFPGSAKEIARSGDEVACLRTASVQAEIDWDDLIYISPTHVSRPDQWIKPSDIMISMANSYALVGKVAIVRSVPQKATFGAFLAAIRPVLIEPYFLLYALRSPRMQAAFRASSSQTTNIANISLGRMRPLPFPLPPLSEQKRIVAKVDELMAQCNRLEAQLKERETKQATLARATLARFAESPTPENLELLFHESFAVSPSDLRKTILTLAVQGKLVPFKPTGKDQTVGDHIDFQNGYAFKSEWFKASGVRLCRNTNISHDVLDWRESAFVDHKIAKELERFTLHEGDIVLSLDRPLIATGLKVARVRKADLPCLLLQRVAKPVPKHDQIDLSYLFLWLHSSAFVDKIDPGRSNGVPHISTRQVQSLPFLLPPLAEQKRIIAKVDQLMSLVDAMENQIASATNKQTSLLNALMAQL